MSESGRRLAGLQGYSRLEAIVIFAVVATWDAFEVFLNTFGQLEGNNVGSLESLEQCSEKTFRGWRSWVLAVGSAGEAIPRLIEDGSVTFERRVATFEMESILASIAAEKIARSTTCNAEICIFVLLYRC
jgi:hypothetical protein